MQRVSKSQWITAALIYGMTAMLFLTFSIIAWVGAFKTNQPGLIFIGAFFLIMAVASGYAYAWVHVNLNAISRGSPRRA